MSWQAWPRSVQWVASSRADRAAIGASGEGCDSISYDALVAEYDHESIIMAAVAQADPADLILPRSASGQSRPSRCSASQPQPSGSPPTPPKADGSVAGDSRSLPWFGVRVAGARVEGSGKP